MNRLFNYGQGANAGTVATRLIDGGSKQKSQAANHRHYGNGNNDFKGNTK